MVTRSPIILLRWKQDTLYQTEFIKDYQNNCHNIHMYSFCLQSQHSYVCPRVCCCMDSYLHLCNIKKKKCHKMSNQTTIQERPYDVDLSKYRLSYGLQKSPKTNTVWYKIIHARTPATNVPDLFTRRLYYTIHRLCCP